MNGSVTTGRRIGISANTDLNINANLTANTTGAGIGSSLIADASGGGTGSIVHASGTTINTNNSNLDIGIVCAPGGSCGSGSGGSTQNITLATINAGSAQVKIRTEDGGIFDANGAGTLNITADSIVLRSEQGVDLDTAVNTLNVRNALNGGGGNVAAANTNGGTLSLQNIFFGGSQSVRNANGDINISNDSSIDVVNNVQSNSGQVTLTGTAGSRLSGGGLVQALRRS